MKKIAYLGPEGTFTHSAAFKLLEQEAYQESQLIACDDISDVLYAVQDQTADFGVVPVENSIEGSVNTSIDMLVNEVDLWVCSEIVLWITHHLVAAPELSEAKKVYSHPQALAQCRMFLKKQYPQIEKVPVSSTVMSLRHIEENLREHVAIVPSYSLDRTRFQVLSENIGDYPMNQTRFYLVSAKKEPASCTECKSSISFELKTDRPGGLLEILALFTKQNINLTKIESRPAKHKLGRYIFIIDCEADLLASDHQIILDGINEQASRWKLLGVFGILGGS